MSLYKLFKLAGRRRRREQEAARLDELAFDELHYYYGYYCYYYNKNNNNVNYNYNQSARSRGRHRRRSICRKLRKFNIDLWVKEEN